MSKNVIISGGGTGGHIMPALALAQYLKKTRPELRIIFAGRKNSMEARLAAEYSLEFRSIPSAPKGRGFKIIKNAFLNLAGFFASLKLMLLENPCAIAAFGGYTSGSLLLAGRIARKNCLIHESNAIPGRVTRLLVNFGVKIALGLDNDSQIMTDLKRKASLKGGLRVTGTPLREEFSKPPADFSDELPGYDEKLPLILIFGGSQGAHNVNLLTRKAAHILLNKGLAFQLVHVCGPNDVNELKSSYHAAGVKAWVFPFVKRLPDLLGLATLCVARSGALSVAEIAARGVPALLIPLPFAADGHQLANAKTLEKIGAAIVGEEKDLTPEKTAKILGDLLEDKEKLAAMRKAALESGLSDGCEATAKFLLGENA